MTEITLSSNLQQLLRIYGNLSVNELARLTGLPQPTIHHILTGATKNPRKKALEMLSKFFSVSVNQLTGLEPLTTVIPERVKEDLQISTVPLIEWGTLKSWPSNCAKIKKQEIFIDTKVAQDSFALVMPDASKEPLFQQNMLLIFDSGKIPKDRDFVIVYFSKTDSIEFNRIFSENNSLYLRQDLQDGDLKLTKINKLDDRILGTLIEGRYRY